MYEIIPNTFGELGNGIQPIPNLIDSPADEILCKYFKQVLIRPFNRENFNRPGIFRNIGRVDSEFSEDILKSMVSTGGEARPFIKCLDMPIKMSGSNEYRIPAEFKSFQKAISKAIAFEHKHNPAVESFYAYLTIDQSVVTLERACHRKPGLHVDGYQGARISPKVWCDHSYIVADADPMSIWNQGFDIEDLDDSKDNIFHAFDRQAHISSEIRVNPSDMYFMDCYTVHSSNIATQNRTFMRLSYSVRQYDRLGNSHNNCFDYEWEMVERNISLTLV